MTKPIDESPQAGPVLKLVTSDGAAIDEAAASAKQEPGETLEPAVSDTPAASEVAFPASDHLRKLRILEAMLFASANPLDEAKLSERLDDGDDVSALLEELKQAYQPRGVNLVKVAGKWAFRTAKDLSFILEKFAIEERRLSKAALETLAIIAYHQPVTRAEIEEVRGVSTSAGTIDILLETNWVRMRGRRRAPGRPVTYGTTEAFLEHFTLESVADLPGMAELKGAGLLDSSLPANFAMPQPSDVAALMPDEMPLDEEDEAGVATQDELEFDHGDHDIDGYDEELDEDAGDEMEADITDDLSDDERPAGTGNLPHGKKPDKSG